MRPAGARHGGRVGRERPASCGPLGPAADHRRPTTRRPPAPGDAAEARRRRHPVRLRDCGHRPGHRLGDLRGSRACPAKRGAHRQADSDRCRARPGRPLLPAATASSRPGHRHPRHQRGQGRCWQHRQLPRLQPPDRARRGAAARAVQGQDFLRPLRACGSARPPSASTTSTLVENGLTDEEARQEASRCLRCDHFGFGAFREGAEIEQW